MKKLFLSVLFLSLLSATPALAAGLTATEVAEHNTSNDCYIIVSERVYDLSGFGEKHPGGADAINKTCGKDGTSLFSTRGKVGEPHPDKAKQTLEQFYVGDLVGSASVDVQNYVPTKSAPTAYDDDFSWGPYPAIWPITAGWLVLLLVAWRANKRWPMVFSRVRLMRATSMTLFVVLVTVASGGVFMATTGKSVLFGLVVRRLHAYAGWTFVLCALTHLIWHVRDLVFYVKQALKRGE